MGDVENETQNALPELGFKRKVFIFYEFLFEMPREALFIMLCYVVVNLSKSRYN